MLKKKMEANPRPGTSRSNTRRIYSDEHMDQHYIKQLDSIREMTRTHTNPEEQELGPKWLNIFSRTSKDEMFARNGLIAIMHKQLKEDGRLSYPFTDVLNCNKDLRFVLDSYERRYKKPQSSTAVRGKTRMQLESSPKMEQGRQEKNENVQRERDRKQPEKGEKPEQQTEQREHPPAQSTHARTQVKGSTPPGLVAERTGGGVAKDRKQLWHHELISGIKSQSQRNRVPLPPRPTAGMSARDEPMGKLMAKLSTFGVHKVTGSMQRIASPKPSKHQLARQPEAPVNSDKVLVELYRKPHYKEPDSEQEFVDNEESGKKDMRREPERKALTGQQQEELERRLLYIERREQQQSDRLHRERERERQRAREAEENKRLAQQLEQERQRKQKEREIQLLRVQEQREHERRLRNIRKSDHSNGSYKQRSPATAGSGGAGGGGRTKERPSEPDKTGRNRSKPRTAIKEENVATTGKEQEVTRPKPQAVDNQSQRQRKEPVETKYKGLERHSKGSQDSAERMDYKKRKKEAQQQQQQQQQPHDSPQTEKQQRSQREKLITEKSQQVNKNVRQLQLKKSAQQLQIQQKGEELKQRHQQLEKKLLAVREGQQTKRDREQMFSTKRKPPGSSSPIAGADLTAEGRQRASSRSNSSSHKQMSEKLMKKPSAGRASELNLKPMKKSSGGPAVKESLSKKLIQTPILSPATSGSPGQSKQQLPDKERLQILDKKQQELLEYTRECFLHHIDEQRIRLEMAEQKVQTIESEKNRLEEEIKERCGILDWLTQTQSRTEVEALGELELMKGDNGMLASGTASVPEFIRFAWRVHQMEQANNANAVGSKSSASKSDCRKKASSGSVAAMATAKRSSAGTSTARITGSNTARITGSDTARRTGSDTARRTGSGSGTARRTGSGTATSSDSARRTGSDRARLTGSDSARRTGSDRARLMGSDSARRTGSGMPMGTGRGMATGSGTAMATATATGAGTGAGADMATGTDPGSAECKWNRIWSPMIKRYIEMEKTCQPGCSNAQLDLGMDLREQLKSDIKQTLLSPETNENSSGEYFQADQRSASAAYWYERYRERNEHSDGEHHKGEIATSCTDLVLGEQPRQSKCSQYTQTEAVSKVHSAPAVPALPMAPPMTPCRVYALRQALIARIRRRVQRRLRQHLKRSRLVKRMHLLSVDQLQMSPEELEKERNIFQQLLAGGAENRTSARDQLLVENALMERKLLVAKQRERHLKQLQAQMLTAAVEVVQLLSECNAQLPEPQSLCHTAIGSNELAPLADPTSSSCNQACIHWREELQLSMQTLGQLPCRILSMLFEPLLLSDGDDPEMRAKISGLEVQLEQQVIRWMSRVLDKCHSCCCQRRLLLAWKSQPEHDLEQRRLLAMQSFRLLRQLFEQHCSNSRAIWLDSLQTIETLYFDQIKANMLNDARPGIDDGEDHH